MLFMRENVIFTKINDAHFSLAINNVIHLKVQFQDFHSNGVNREMFKNYLAV
jgi:hypothetical protein